ncbi:MAG: shikimate dehydrogenase [Thaumarchaeota archaeon]|nr:shikimate dehydrogenase [Nitrososphaerota archaeon]
MVNSAFEAMEMEAVYAPLNVSPGALAETFDRLKQQGVKGFNVTMPHKTSILQLLDSSDDTSSKIGAVNTVSRERASYIGYNTDVEGIVQPLRSRGVERIDRAAVVGTGGAARAFCAAMAKMKCKGVTVVSRDAKMAGGFVSQMTASFPSIEFVTSDFGGPINGEFELVFNASPIGTRGVPLPRQVGAMVESHQLVFDAVYSPNETELIKLAESRGSRTIRGHEMLLEQAIGAIRIWTGRPPPAEVMRKALIHSLEVTAS